eukprot:2427422-Pyramimonas_sp.AAC.1
MILGEGDGTPTLGENQEKYGVDRTSLMPVAGCLPSESQSLARRRAGLGDFVGQGSPRASILAEPKATRVPQSPQNRKDPAL